MTSPALPVELLLEVIPHIPYTPQTLVSLRLTSWEMQDLLQRHERGLVSEIKRRQFDDEQVQLFPGLADKNDWHSLNKLSLRLDCLDEMHARWLKIVNHGLELRWLKGRWERLHKAGLLLLYRLQDASITESSELKSEPTADAMSEDLGAETADHARKIAMLDSLPPTSLACILFKLISSIKILRVYGPAPIHVVNPVEEGSAMRNDIELAAEELLLRHGPSFFVALVEAGASSPPKLTDSNWAVRELEAELADMLPRQFDPDRPPTLIASLRRALAKSCNCEVHHTVSKMWEILSCTGFDEIDQQMVAQIVRGEDVKAKLGMKRIW